MIRFVSSATFRLLIALAAAMIVVTVLLPMIETGTGVVPAALRTDRTVMSIALLSLICTFLSWGVLELTSRIRREHLSLKASKPALSRSENLAALGSLAAGLAHVLNTPIGNSMIVATTLKDRTNAISAVMDAGMRRSALESYLADARCGTDLLVRNLQRIANLVESFKHISIDTSNEERSRFNLSQMVDETLSALRPRLHSGKHLVIADIDQKLMLDSFKRLLEQVLVGLISNAIQHGLAGKIGGIVSVCGWVRPGQRVRISIRDNGHGIPAANLSRVFDPFFTTQFGRGSSGMGLYVIRTVIENALGGTIHVDSKAGEWTEITLEVPVLAPLRQFDGIEGASDSN